MKIIREYLNENKSFMPKKNIESMLPSDIVDVSHNYFKKGNEFKIIDYDYYKNKYNKYI